MTIPSPWHKPEEEPGPDMTPKEFVTALRAMDAGLPKGAYTFISFSTYSDPQGCLSASLYANWPSGDPIRRVQADTFRELLDKADAAWSLARKELHDKKVRKMALAIIELTEDAGVCDVEALKDRFSGDEVTKYATVAEAEAQRITGNSKFAIHQKENDE